MKSRVRLRSGLLGAVTLWVGAAEGLGDVRSLWEICGRFGKIGGGLALGCLLVSAERGVIIGISTGGVGTNLWKMYVDGSRPTLNLGESEDFLLDNLQETMETMLLLVSIFH